MEGYLYHLSRHGLAPLAAPLPDKEVQISSDLTNVHPYHTLALKPALRIEGKEPNGVLGSNDSMKILGIVK